VTQKLLAACLAAAVITGGAAGGAAVVDVVTPVASPAIQPVVLGIPLPLDPAADVPTVDQLNAVLYGLADPAVSFSAKGYLVEGGIGRVEARAGDGLMKNAQAKGQLPLSFAVANIAPTAAGAASAVVTATGPAMAPITQTIVFVNQGGWKLSRASAGLVLSMFNG
jgi:hypothetical protein